MLVQIFLYMLAGAIGGLLIGLIGTGIGPIVVPLIVLMSPMIGLPNNLSMKVAIATSLSVIICTTAFSALWHHRNQMVQWTLFRSLLPGSIVGAVIGALIVIFLPNAILKMIFGILLLGISVFMLIKPKRIRTKSLPGFWKLWISSSMMSASSNMLGVSDGLLMVPYLKKHNVSMHHAIATATILIFPVSLIGLSVMCVAGISHHLPKSVGYIYLPAFVPITITSIIFANVGIRLGKKLSENTLRLIFGIIMVLISLKMLIY